MSTIEPLTEADKVTTGQQEPLLVFYVEEAVIAQWEERRHVLCLCFPGPLHPLSRTRRFFYVEVEFHASTDLEP